MALSGAEASRLTTAARARRGRIERLGLAVEIVVAYARTRHLLGRAPIAVVVARLRTPTGTFFGDDALAQAHSLAGAVVRVLALMPGDARCLSRSLVLSRLLARRGIEARLVIATRTTPDFIAHAWVEHAGQPLLSPGDDAFGRLVEL